MTTIVNVIDPMLHFAVVQEGLHVLKTLPMPIDLPVGWVVLDRLDHAMSRHDLTHIL